MEYLERKSSIDALTLEYYPNSPESIALNNKGIFLKPKHTPFKTIEELEKFVGY